MSPSDIKALREHLGINQAELGQLLNVHAMTISKWERGAATPNAWLIHMMTMLTNYANNQKFVKLWLQYEGGAGALRRILEDC